MIFVGQWCPKKRHDPVAQHLVNGSFVSVNRIHHDPQYRIDELLRFFWIKPLQQAGRASDVGKENRNLLPFSFQRLPRGQYLFSEVFRDVAAWRRNSGDSSRCGRCGLIDQLTANSAKRRVKTVRFITMRTNRFKPHPAAVAKDRIRQILALTLRANHDGGQFLLGCIGPQFRRVEPKSEQRREQAVYIVPGYAKATYSIVTKLMFAALGELHRPSRR